MSQEEKKEPVENRVLDDKELDSISGGGKFRPVSGCPRGVTRIPWYSGLGGDYVQCKGCPNFSTGQGYGGEGCGLGLEGLVQTE